MKIIFLAYRSWAIKVFAYIEQHPRIEVSTICFNYEELYAIDVSKYDLLITVGLSEVIQNDIYDKIETIGLHCAELDRYSYGSPLQLQIIDGLLETKHRIFRLTSGGIDSLRSHAHTRQYANEVTLSLHGGIDQIFEQMTYTSIHLINSFLDSYPNTIWRVWPAESIMRPRRKEEDSKLTFEEFSNLSTLDLYNLIRSLEDPYPNLHIEDEEGILYFKKVIFKKK